MEEEGELGSTCRGDDPPEAAMPEEKGEPGAGRLRVQFRGTKQNSIYKNSRSIASVYLMYNTYINIYIYMCKIKYIR